MSTSAAMARTAVRPADRGPARITREAGPRLRVVAGRAADRSPVAVAILCLLLLVGGLVALLMVNISLGHGSYELDRLQEQSQRLGEQRAALADILDERAAPQELERAARRAGMVPAEQVTFVSLTTGRTLGEGAAATTKRPAKGSAEAADR